MAQQNNDDYLQRLYDVNNPEQAALQKLLLDNLTTYDTNKKVLESMGVMDRIGKIPGVGLATNVLGKLAIPGNIIRGGLFEATGNATPELQAVSGLDEFLKLATGKIRPTFGQLDTLASNPNDNNFKKFAKVGTAFVGDVLTDPLSYIGAPSLLSRTAKAEHLARSILGSAPVEGTVSLSDKLFNLHNTPSEFIDELASKSRVEVLSKLQKEANVKPAPGTPRDIAEQLPNEGMNPFVNPEAKSPELAKQYLANHLAQGLLYGGQPEVIRRLTTIYGSKEKAMEAWKLLPEDFKGGIVLTTPLGTPIKNADGTFARLTPGTGEGLGKFGELLNTGRLGAALGKNFITRNTGVAGQVRANVIRNLWNKEEHLVGNDRFIDYIATKDGMEAAEFFLKDATNEAINTSGFSAHQRKLAEQKGYTKEEFQEKFKAAYNTPKDFEANHTLTPGLKEDAKLATTLEDFAYNAANNFRVAINGLREEALKLGIDVGMIGDPETFVPLILERIAKEKLLLTERGRINESDFSTMYGRRQYMFASQNADEAAKRGFPSRLETPEEYARRLKKKGYSAEEAEQIMKTVPPERINPDTYYNNPISANKIENEIDPKFGMDKYLTDPTKIYLHYATDLMNKMATRRMVNTMQQYGTLVRDVEAVAKEVDAFTSSTLLAGIMRLNGNDVLAKVYEAKVAEYGKNLDKLLKSTELKDLQDRIIEVRAMTKIKLDVAVKENKAAKTAIRTSEKEVEKYTPNMDKNIKELTDFEAKLLPIRQEMKEVQDSIDTIMSKMRVLSKDTDFGKEYVRLLRQELNKLGRFGHPLYKKALRAEIKKINETYIYNLEELNPLSMQAALAEAELTLVQEERVLLIERKAATEFNKTNNYVAALEKRRDAYKKLEESTNRRITARKEFNDAASAQLIDSVKSIDTIVHAYIYADNAAKKFRYDTRFDTMRFKQEEMAKLNAIRYQLPSDAVQELEDALKVQVKAFSDMREGEARLLEKDVSAKMKLIKDTIGTTRNTRFGNAIGNYVKHVIDASKKLSVEQYEAYKVLKSEDDMKILIAQIAESSADETVMGQAYGDIARAYESIRQYIPRSYFDDFAKIQKDVLGFKSIADLRNSLFREKKTASEFGKTLRDEGMKVLGFNKATQDMFASTGVNDILEQRFLMQNNPAKFEKYINDVADPLLNVWKWSVTLGRGPGFIINNLLGGVTMNYMFGVTVKNHMDAAKDIAAFKGLVDKNVKNNPELPYNENFKNAELEMLRVSPARYRSFLEFMDKGGILGTESAATIKALQEGGINTPEAVLRGGVQNAIIFSTEPANRAEEIFRNIMNKTYSLGISKMFTDGGQMSEVFNRYAAFLNGVERFGDYKTAMDRVYLIHFNYQDLSKMEVWARRAVPFYTWSRNNVPAQMRVIGMQTGKIQKFMYANEEFKNQYGADESWMQQVLPEFVTNQNGWVSRFMFNNNNIGFFLRLPVEDLNRLFNSVGVPNLENAASMLGPTFKAPYEVATGTNLNTGQAANPAGESVPGYYNLFRPIPGAIKSTTGGDTRASSNLVRFIQDVFPLLGTAERLTAGGAALLPGEQPNITFSKNQQNAGLSNILNVTGLGSAGGFSAVTVTPGMLSAEVNRRSDLQKADIRKIAASGNYDTDFIRKQLRLGYTPEDIALMLESGLGKLPDTVAGPKVTDAAYNKYANALQGLGG